MADRPLPFFRSQGYSLFRALMPDLPRAATSTGSIFIDVSCERWFVAAIGQLRFWLIRMRLTNIATCADALGTSRHLRTL